MVDDSCQICRERLRLLPYVCSYCGKSFCVNHRLPEKHNCKEMAKVKEAAKALFQEKELKIRPPMYKDALKYRKIIKKLVKWIKLKIRWGRTR